MGRAELRVAGVSIFSFMRCHTLYIAQCIEGKCDGLRPTASLHTAVSLGTSELLRNLRAAGLTYAEQEGNFLSRLA